MDTSDTIYVAGHRGMAGSAIVRHLRAAGHPPARIVTRSHADLDLTDQAAVRAFFARPRMVRWLVLLACFKVGDAIGSPMVKPLLVDVKMTTTQIGFISGTLGSAVALVGALVGGWMAGRFGRVPALVVGGLVHASLMAGYALGSSLENSVVIGDDHRVFRQ